MLKQLWHRLIWIPQDVKAWRRGETRVTPHGTRGRIYEKKVSPETEVLISSERGEDNIRTRSVGMATISAKKWVAAEGRWHDLGVISKAEVHAIMRGEKR